MDPVAFTIFGNEVRWYGILIGIGMLIAVFISYNRAPKFDIEKDRIIDLCLFCLPAAVIGARAWYVAFNWEQYQGDIGKIINIRLGGLAFHGGLLFALVTAIILCKVWKINPWNLTDLAAPVIALAQSIGRWGNYINHEAFGTPTDLPWAIEVNGEMVHPTFLYESLWCFLLFWVLLYISKKRTFYGQIVLLYGILYSIERICVEALRTDSLYVMGFRTAQIVSLIAIIGCTIAYLIRRRRNVI